MQRKGQAIRWIAALLALASGGAPAAARAAQAIKVGYLPVTGHAKFFVAKERGFFAQEGLDAELVEFVNSADGINAVKAGKVDVGAFGTTAPLVHIAKGTDLRLIGGIMGEDAALITTAEKSAAIEGIPDLKGKKVATVRLATGDAVLRGALHDAGLDWKKDLEIFELKSPPAVIEAVKSGQVDVGVVWGPHDLRAEEQGLKVIVRSRTLQPGHPCCRLAIRAEQLQQRETWVKLLRALLRAEKFARDNRTETVDAIVKYVKLDRGLVEKAYYAGYLEQGTDPNANGVERFWKTMQSSALVEAKGGIRPNIELTFYKAALDSLVKESPGDPFWAKLEKDFKERNL